MKSQGSPKKILHIIDSLGRGGAENLLINYLQELTEYNHILLYFHAQHDLVPEIKNVQVICLNKSENFQAIPIIWSLKKIIREENVDIVHSHSYWSNIYARFATPKNIKLINHYHFALYDTMQNERKVKQRLWLDKLTYNKRIHIITVSKYVESIMKNICGYNSNITTIRNFIGDIFYNNTSKHITKWQRGETLKLIAVGSLKKEKNYELLIDAFKTLKDYPISLDVYGWGESIGAYKQVLKNENITNLHFLGLSDNVESLFSNYHAYVMPSLSEACPLSPLEAMSNSLPLILSDIAALKEIAHDNALFFKNKDSQDFVRLILNILNGEKTLMFSEQGYKEVLDKYSKERFLIQLKSIYENQ